MILMIDNFCSFTYNIVQYFGQLGQAVVVWQNNECNLEDINTLNPDAIVIGPGPCTPSESGISLSIITHINKPILGVCLGHQAIAQVFGAKVVQANNIMHGRCSTIYHNNAGIFTDLPNPFRATRYHSLVIDPHSLPDCLTITAHTFGNDGEFDPHHAQEIMGISHNSLPIHGVQFHPESILSEEGHRLFNNFLKLYQLDKISDDNLPKIG